MSNGLQALILSIEDSKNSAGEIALEAASDFAVGFAFGPSFCDVGFGFLIMSHFAYRHHMQSAVQASVAAAIEPVSDGIS